MHTNRTLCTLTAVLLLTGSMPAQDYTIEQIYTPRGTPVQVLNRYADFSEQDRIAADQWAITNYPNAVLIDNSTKFFNCHNGAWNTYGQSRWMNFLTVASAPNVSLYWSDLSYIYLFSTTWDFSNTQSDKMVTNQIPVRLYYDGGDHSAIYGGEAYHSQSWPTLSFATSKWGDGPTMCHWLWDCPYTYVAIDAYQFN